MYTYTQIHIRKQYFYYVYTHTQIVLLFEFHRVKQFISLNLTFNLDSVSSMGNTDHFCQVNVKSLTHADRMAVAKK